MIPHRASIPAPRIPYPAPIICIHSEERSVLKCGQPATHELVTQFEGAEEKRYPRCKRHALADARELRRFYPLDHPLKLKITVSKIKEAAK
jgi:hypothetical protein